MIFALLVLFIFCKSLEWTGIINFSDPASWREIPTWILDFVCRLTSLIQPHQVIWEGEKPKSGHKILFVSNHQLTAFDVPLSLALPYLEAGIFPRGIADRLHFKIPIWCHLGWIFGTFPGSRETCARVMQSGQPIMVYPGGSKEVWRSTSEKPYSLLWGERKGFAKMAIEHGYTIVPISAMGMGEMWYNLYDFPAQLVFKLMGDTKRAMQGDTIPLCIPNPFQFQKQYFRFGKPIDCSQYESNEESITALRDLVKDTIYQGFDVIEKIRSADPDRYFFKRNRNCINKSK